MIKERRPLGPNSFEVQRLLLASSLEQINEIIDTANDAILESAKFGSVSVVRVFFSSCNPHSTIQDILVARFMEVGWKEVLFKLEQLEIGECKCAFMELNS